MLKREMTRTIGEKNLKSLANPREARVATYESYAGYYLHVVG